MSTETVPANRTVAPHLRRRNASELNFTIQQFYPLQQPCCTSPRNKRACPSSASCPGSVGHLVGHTWHHSSPWPPRALMIAPTLCWKCFSFAGATVNAAPKLQKLLADAHKRAPTPVAAAWQRQPVRASSSAHAVPPTLANNDATKACSQTVCAKRCAIRWVLSCSIALQTSPSARGRKSGIAKKKKKKKSPATICARIVRRAAQVCIANNGTERTAATLLKSLHDSLATRFRIASERQLRRTWPERHTLGLAVCELRQNKFDHDTRWTAHIVSSTNIKPLTGWSRRMAPAFLPWDPLSSHLLSNTMWGIGNADRAPGRGRHCLFHI